MLVVALGPLGLDVLLDGVDLALVLNQFLLDVIKPVVNLALQDLILLGVVLDRVESDFLGQPLLVGLQELPDFAHSRLFVIKLLLEVVSVLEFDVDVRVHRFNFELSLLHLLPDAALEVFHFL